MKLKLEISKKEIDIAIKKYINAFGDKHVTGLELMAVKNREGTAFLNFKLEISPAFKPTKHQIAMSKDAIYAFSDMLIYFLKKDADDLVKNLALNTNIKYVSGRAIIELFNGGLDIFITR